jgi:CheY-like chemotaxis protein
MLADRRNPRVLVVDDDPWTRTVLAALLSGEGFEVLEAKTGEEGLDLSQRQQPDVVLLDLALPTLSGLDVLRQLRSAPATHDLPVVVVSAYSDMLGQEDARQASGMLSKPFDYDEIIGTVGRLTAPQLARIA